LSASSSDGSKPSDDEAQCYYVVNARNWRKRPHVPATVKYNVDAYTI